MELHSNAPVLALQAGEVVTLEDARGTRIQARTGTVWVTEEANPEDRIVGPGEAIVVSRDGLTVIQALQSAWVAVVPVANDPVDVLAS
jgi:hypothetical protein